MIFWELKILKRVPKGGEGELAILQGEVEGRLGRGWGEVEETSGRHIWVPGPPQAAPLSHDLSITNSQF